MRDDILEIRSIADDELGYSLRRDSERDEIAVIINPLIDDEVKESKMRLWTNDIREFTKRIQSFPNKKDLDQWRIDFGSTNANNDETQLILPDKSQCIVCEGSAHVKNGFKIGEDVFVHTDSCIDILIDEIKDLVQEFGVVESKL